MRVLVKYSRKDTYSGYAFYGDGDVFTNYDMKLRIPKTEIDIVKLSKLFLHEFEHILGYRHNMMLNAWGKETYRGIEDVIKNLTVQKKQVVKKRLIDVRQKRYEHAVMMLRKKESLLKRITNQIKRWKQKVKYYERLVPSLALNFSAKLSEIKGEIK